MSNYELRHAKQQPLDLGEIAFNVLAVATRMDHTDPMNLEEIQALCDAARILFSLSDLEDSFRDLWEHLHE